MRRGEKRPEPRSSANRKLRFGDLADVDFVDSEWVDGIAARAFDEFSRARRRVHHVESCATAGTVDGQRRSDKELRQLFDESEAIPTNRLTTLASCSADSPFQFGLSHLWLLQL